MARQAPWDALCARARAAEWDAHTTYAENSEWGSWALRARSVHGRRVVALWRGRPGGPFKFTSACTWNGDPDHYFAALNAAGLRDVLDAG